MKAILYDRWGHFLHELNLYKCNQFTEINGEDYIEIQTDEPLAKGDRIIVWDGADWFEYVFNEGEQVHNGGQTYTMTCDNSLMWDLSLRHVSYAGWDSADAKYALTEILKLHPAWSVGSVLSTDKKKLEYERESAYQALLETCGAFNCEIKKEITVDKTGVVKRTVSLVEQIGQKTNIRFDYGDGIFGVHKTINAEPVLTACYGYGSGIGDEELKCYVTNDQIVEEWGMSDGHGAIIHAEGEFSDSDIEDLSELEAATTDHLNAHSSPSITYEMEEPYLALQGAKLGDTVQSVDADFNPPVRLDTRVGAIERDLITNIVTKAVFGNVISYLPDALARSYDQGKVIIKQTNVIGGLRSDLKSTQQQLAEAQRELAQTKTDLEIAQRNAQSAREDANAAKKQANDLAVTVEQQQADIDQMRDEISEVASSLSSARKTIQMYSGQLQELDALTAWHTGFIHLNWAMSAAQHQAFINSERNYQANGGQSQSALAMYNELIALPVSDPGGDGPSVEEINSLTDAMTEKPESEKSTE